MKTISTSIINSSIKIWFFILSITKPNLTNYILFILLLCPIYFIMSYLFYYYILFILLLYPIYFIIISYIYLHSSFVEISIVTKDKLPFIKLILVYSQTISEIHRLQIALGEGT